MGGVGLRNLLELMVSPVDLSVAISSAMQGIQASIELVKGGLGARESAAVLRVEVDLLNQLSEVVGQLTQAKDAPTPAVVRLPDTFSGF
jgi:hypothetical protein